MTPVITTAPDDGDMHELARVITRELRDHGHEMLVYIWGWGNLEERILQYDEARKALDPCYGPFSGRILDNTEELLRGQVQTQSKAPVGTYLQRGSMGSIGHPHPVPEGFGDVHAAPAGRCKYVTANRRRIRHSASIP